MISLFFCQKRWMCLCLCVEIKILYDKQMKNKVIFSFGKSFLDNRHTIQIEFQVHGFCTLHRLCKEYYYLFFWKIYIIRWLKYARLFRIFWWNCCFYFHSKTTMFDLCSPLYLSYQLINIVLDHQFYHWYPLPIILIKVWTHPTIWNY